MVTKQQQLEWLAKECDKWPVNGEYFTMNRYAVGACVHAHVITREEWQQERDKMQKQDSSWHERGELPPVGCECDAMRDGKWVAVEVLRHRVNNVGFNVAAVMDCTSFSVFWSADFRPLRTEREKAIDEMAEIICAGGYFTSRDGAASKIAERIYDSGYRKQ